MSAAKVGVMLTEREKWSGAFSPPLAAERPSAAATHPRQQRKAPAPFSLGALVRILLRILTKDNEMQNTHVTIRVMLVVGVLLALNGAAQASLQDGLVGCYPFQGNANNETGSAPDGSVSGATLSDDRFGIVDSAYVFDGVDDYIEIPNTDAVFNLTNSWTLACWAKPFTPATDSRDDPLIWKIAISSTELYAGDEDTFLLSWGYQWQDGQPGNVFNTGLERAADDHDFGLNSAPHTPGSWHHVVGSYDGAYLRIYADGVLEGIAYIGPVVAYTGPAALRIGNVQHSAHIFGPEHIGAFDGAIDDVRIYSRALTDAEVQELYLIPEPATLLLLGAALPILSAIRHRRKEQPVT